MIKKKGLKLSVQAPVYQLLSGFLNVLEYSVNKPFRFADVMGLFTEEAFHSGGLICHYHITGHNNIAPFKELYG